MRNATLPAAIALATCVIANAASAEGVSSRPAPNTTAPVIDNKLAFILDNPEKAAPLPQCHFSIQDQGDVTPAEKKHPAPIIVRSPTDAPTYKDIHYQPSDTKRALIENKWRTYDDLYQMKFYKAHQ